MNTRRDYLKATAGTMIVGGLAGCQQSSESSDYPQNDIEWLGFDGTFRAFSLAISEYLPDYLPNQTNIEVTQPDGWIEGISQIYQAEPDGYTLGMANIPGNIVTQVIQDVPYDLSEFTWIGQVDEAVYGIAVPADSEYESIQDLQEADEVSFSGLGAATTDIATVLGTDALGINLNHVSGYSGSEDQITAMLRGEADATSLPMTTTTVQSAVENGDIQFLVMYTEDSTDEYPDIPPVTDVTDDETMIGFTNDRLVCGPPDLPGEIQETLSDSLMEMMESEEFQNWAEENDQQLDPGDQSLAEEKVSEGIDLINEKEAVLAEYL